MPHNDKIANLRAKVAEVMAQHLEPDDDPDYTVAEVMAATGVSQAAVCQAALDGRLIGRKVRRGPGKPQWRFREEDVLAWAASRAAYWARKG